MNKHNLCIFAVTGAVTGAVMGAVLISWSPLAAAETTDTLLARHGQFQLDDGETKAVLRGAAIKGYRVCMDDEPEAVPLKVTHDGKVTLVEPGECQLIEANTIKLASASKLHEDMTLIGSFNGGSRKTYRTDVSVAQTARND